MKVYDKVIVRSYLLRSGLYLISYEILKFLIIEELKSFYCRGYLSKYSNKINKKSCELYKTEVLGLDKDPFIASLRWYNNMNVLSESDINLIKEIREYRNRIAHELINFLLEENSEIPLGHISLMRKLIYKIKMWWIMEVESQINPEFENIRPDDIQLPVLQILDQIIEIVSEYCSNVY